MEYIRVDISIRGGQFAEGVGEYIPHCLPAGVRCMHSTLLAFSSVAGNGFLKVT